MARSSSNSNVRGSSYQRRRRKLWLLEKFGDGQSAPCCMEKHKASCPGRVDFYSMSVDRFPLAGIDGGRYVRGNIRPAWGPCNSADGGEKGAEQKRKLAKASA